MKQKTQDRYQSRGIPLVADAPVNGGRTKTISYFHKFLTPNICKTQEIKYNIGISYLSLGLDQFMKPAMRGNLP
ncbi:MAG: hypothetical protein WC180_02920 [Candidatus Paceibacterota bacterium]